MRSPWAVRSLSALDGKLHPLSWQKSAHQRPLSESLSYNRYNVFGEAPHDLAPQIDNLASPTSSYGGAMERFGSTSDPRRRRGDRDFFGCTRSTEGVRRPGITRTCLSSTATAQTATHRARIWSFYSFKLYSNFTYFSSDPIRGDEIEQGTTANSADSRRSTADGFRGAGSASTRPFGVNVRHDSIHNTLYHAQARRSA